MQAADLMIAGLSGGLVVVSGGLYAFFFALGRLRSSRLLICLAYAAYGLLVAGAVLLSMSLDLSRAWLAVIVFALVGYFLLPRVIWHLCEGTHATIGTGRTPA